MNPETQTPTAISAAGLGKRYGEQWALRDFDLEVPAGSVLGLLGHNGAGKTTAIRIFTTLALPSAGRASIDGFDSADPEAEAGLSADALRFFALARVLLRARRSRVERVSCVEGDAALRDAWSAAVLSAIRAASSGSQWRPSSTPKTTSRL